MSPVHGSSPSFPAIRENYAIQTRGKVSPLSRSRPGVLCVFPASGFVPLALLQGAASREAEESENPRVESQHEMRGEFPKPFTSKLVQGGKLRPKNNEAGKKIIRA